MEESGSEGNLQTLLNSLYDPYLVARVHALSAVQSSLSEAKTGQVKRVARCIMTSLIYRKFTESKWVHFQYSVLIKDIVMSSHGLSVIVDALSDLTNSRKIDDDQARVNAMELVNYIVLHSPSLKNESDDGSKIIHLIALSTVFCECYDLLSSSKFLNKAQHIANSFAASKPNVFSMMISKCCEKGENVPSLAFSSMINLIPQALIPMVKSAINDCLFKKVIQSKVAVPFTSLDRYGLFLQSLTNEEWLSKLSPSASDSLDSASLKLLKKSPEGSSYLVASLLSNVNSDLSQFILQGGNTCCIRLLKSSEALVRKYGVTITKQLFFKSYQTDAISSLYQSILDSLQGKGGALTTLDHRVSFLEALKGLFDQSQATYSKEINNFLVLKSWEVFTCLMTSLDKEVDESHKHSIASVLGDVLVASLRSETVKPPSYDLLLSLGGANPKNRVLYLEVLSHAIIKNTELTMKFQSLIPQLLLIIKDTLKKPPAIQFDAVLAVSLLFQLLPSADSESTKIINSIFAQPSFITIGSFIHYLETYRIVKATESNGAEIYGDLLCNSIVSLSIVSIQNYSLSKSQLSIAVDHIVWFGLMHDNSFIRKRTQQSLIRIIESDSHCNLLMPIIRNIWDHVCDYSTKLTSYNISRISNFKTRDENLPDNSSNGPKFFSPSRIFGSVKELFKVLNQETLRTRIFLDDNISEHLMLCLQVICHPFISESYKTSFHYWNTFLQSILKEHLKFLSKESMYKINDHILSLLSSPDAQSRATAFRIISLASSNTLLEKCLTPLFSTINSNIQSSKILSMTPFEVLLLTSFENALQSELSNDSNTNQVEEVRITNADRKKDTSRSSRKGHFGRDEDEEWLDRIKKEKELKIVQSKQLSSDATLDKKRQDLLAQRSKLEIELNFTRCSIDALEYFVVNGNIDIVLQSIVLDSGLYLSLISLLRSDILGSQIDRLLSLIIRKGTYGRLPVSFSRDLVDSLHIVTRYIDRPLDEESGESEVQRRKGLQSSLSSIQNLLKASSIYLTNPSISNSRSPWLVIAIFPVLRGLLSFTNHLPGCEQAYSILESLCTSDVFQSDGFIFKDFIPRLLRLSLHIITHLKVKPTPDLLLIRILSSVSLTDESWQIIFGDDGLLSSNTNVRKACIQAISASITNNIWPDNLTYETLLFMSTFDEDEAVASMTSKLPFKATFTAGNTITILKHLISHTHQHVRDRVSRAIAGSFRLSSENDSLSAFERLKDIYISSLPSTPSVKSTQRDASGKIDISSYLSMEGGSRKGLTIEDNNVPSRITIVSSILQIGKQKSIDISSGSLPSIPTLLVSLFDFLLNHAVADKDASVRKVSVDAGRCLTDSYGPTYPSQILAKFHEILEQSPPSKGGDAELEAFDHRHEAAVILLGAAARYLPKDDPNVLVITDVLIDTLKTPSEVVQIAVADSVAQLIPSLKGTDRASSLIEKLIDQILNGSTYGHRRGAAFGLSAMIKGLGIPTLKNHDIINRLKDACSNGTPTAREGCLLAFECLSQRLGLLFEPYVTTIIPILLKCFSHSSDHVREASQVTAKVVMEKLSAHGVKQVLTPILASLPTESAWKSRQEAIRLLGTMAFCNPKQLGVCLPQIIPPLVEIGNSDPHPKVKESAKNALSDISSVIKNPEILHLSPFLLAALADPANKTKAALEALLECEFMHAIDAPSLAILVPILGRALQNRGGDLKRKASAITGNITTMVGGSEAKILGPYLGQLLPGLKDCLMDPIPDVRATSAKALGKIIAGISEEDTKPIVAWLLSTIRSEASPVERSGAAQGLSECCASFNTTYTEQIIRQVLEYREASQSAPREGLLWFFSFLPTSLNDSFSQFISLCLPVILSGLSDDDDGVREVALRAGQVIVTTLGRNHASDILPSLMEGMFDEDFRIRHASITLLGELIFLLSDTKSPGAFEKDDDNDDGDLGYQMNTGSATSSTIIMLRQILGIDTTNNMLASLFIIRSDTASTVRQISLSVWKAIVNNTGKTLVEIMPNVVEQMIIKICDPSAELRQIACRSLGEVVKKQGDRVLPTIIPALQNGLQNSDPDYRQGVCQGLAEVVAAATRRQIDLFIDIIIPALHQAVSDSSAQVRQQGAQAFLMLYKSVGSSCIDDVIPPILRIIQRAMLEFNDSALNASLLGLQELVSTRPRDMLEYLIPKLSASPMSSVNATALASVAPVAGGALHHHFTELIPNLVKELYSADAVVKSFSPEQADQIQIESQRFEAIRKCATAVMQAVTTPGVNYLISDLGKQIEHDTNPRRRQWGCWLAEMFFRKSKAEYVEYVPVFLKFLLSRVADTDRSCLEAVNDALLALTTSPTLSLDMLMSMIDFIGNCVASAASDARHRAGGVQAILSSSSQTEGEYILPLLTIPKAVEPFMTIYLHGVMNGAIHIREQAADAICSIISMCEATMLKPFLIKATGPLIRVAGERYPSTLKTALLNALIALLGKGGIALKAFAPQLQTTFIKTLNDPSKTTRTRAAVGLEMIMPLVMRVDPILTELCTNAQSAESNALKSSILEAIGGVLIFGGDKATATSIDRVSEVFLSTILDEDENIRNGACMCALGLGPFADQNKLQEMMIDLLEVPISGEAWTSSCGRIIGLSGLLISAGNTKAGDKKEGVLSMIYQAFDDERGNGNMKVTACKCVSLLLTLPKHIKAEEQKSEFRGVAQTVIQKFSKVLVTLAQDVTSSDIRKSALHAIKQGAKYYPILSAQNIQVYMPVIIASLHDLNLGVKSMGERAMKHLLDGGSNQTVLASYCNKADSDSSLFVRDYAKRIISKLPTDSDDEEKMSKW